MRFMAVLSGLFLTAMAFAQNIVTPVFVLKDGDATITAYSGTDKVIYVDGGAQQSIGWITFQMQGIDVSKIASAKLVLYVKALTNPGTLRIKLLSLDVAAPENNVGGGNFVFNNATTDSLALGTAHIETTVQLDLTAAVKSGTFKGIALVSDDGLAISFDSKEGHLAPILMLTNNVVDVAAKWLSGTIVPAAGLGKDGDYYLNTSSGDVSTKTSGVWAVVTNIAGAVGTPGTQGPKGDKGDTGSFPRGTTVGDMQYWNGTQWVMLPKGLPKQILTITPYNTIAWDYPSYPPSFITDFEGNIYHTITIGRQTWTVENLKSTKYRDGTAIPLVTDNTAWAGLSTPGYCWYTNDSLWYYKNTYGALYNWYVVNPTNPKKLAPYGWHVATDADWNTLSTFVDFAGGAELKEAGTAHWAPATPPNEWATNALGFSALPGGYRWLDGTFANAGYYGYWWTTAEGDASITGNRVMNNNSADLLVYHYQQRCGMSVRLVRD